MGWVAAAAPYIGVALSAAGTGAAIAGQKESARKMEQDTVDEMNRQRRYRGESKQVYAQSLAQSTPDKANQQIQEGTEQRAGEYAKLGAVPLSSSQAGPMGNEQMTGRDRGIVQQSNSARAALMGPSEWQLQQQLKDLRAMQRQAMIGQFSRNSGEVLPLEINAASHAGDALTNSGQAMSTLGTLSSFYGMTAPRTPKTPKWNYAKQGLPPEVTYSDFNPMK